MPIERLEIVLETINCNLCASTLCEVGNELIWLMNLQEAREDIGRLQVATDGDDEIPDAPPLGACEAQYAKQRSVVVVSKEVGGLDWPDVDCQPVGIGQWCFEHWTSEAGFAKTMPTLCGR